MIYETIKLNASGYKPYPLRNYRPTMLSTCHRMLWFLANAPDEVYAIEPETQLLFDEGQAQEEIIVAQIRRNGYIIPDESRNMSVLPKLGKHTLRAKIDGLVHGQNLGSTEYILEAKSMSDEVFRRFKDSQGKSTPYYINQVQAYLQALEGRAAIIFAKNRN